MVRRQTNDCSYRFTVSIKLPPSAAEEKPHVGFTKKSSISMAKTHRWSLVENQDTRTLSGNSRQ